MFWLNGDIKNNLDESMEQFKLITEQSLIGIIIIQDGLFKYFNDTFSEVTGYSVEEVKSWAPYEFLKTIHPEDREFVMDQARKKQEGDPDVVTRYQCRAFHKNGEMLWVEIFGKTINYRGRPADLVMTLDITEKMKTEQELKESEVKFRTAFYSNTSSMTISTIEEGKLIEVNDAFLDSVGFKREEVIGKTSKELNLWGDKSQRDSIIQRVKEKGKVSNVQFERRAKDGRNIDGLFSSNIIYLKGKPYLLNIVTDITDRVLYERELKKSEKRYRDAYNRIELYKDILTHDINNILQNILSADQLTMMLCTSKEEKEKIVDFLKIIKSQVDRGAKLVQNVQKLSQVEDQEINLERMEILNILRKTIKLIENSFKGKNLKIQIEFNEDKLWLKVNYLIQDVFENIIINSIRYNNNPLIEIIIKITKIKENSINYCKIEFIDNGCGIEDNRKVKLFDRTFKSASPKHGMGLGLSLVNKIVKTYNGKIWIEDRVKGDYSKGSNFVILIPEV